MRRTPDDIGSDSGEHASVAPDPHRLAALLYEDDIDAAIDAGLMAFVDDARSDLDAGARALIASTQQRLRIT